MMRCCSKEKIASNGRAPKPENVINHICPSKLSKRELEDLYFTLVHNNSELKQTINELSDKIRYQTTKLQRMLNTQRAYMGTETRDCCATAKAIVQEQKLVIVDLKNANEHLQEQVKNLNMKLCSTKQFLKRSPVPRHTSAGKAKLPTRLDSAKNSSTSAVNLKRFEKSPMGTKSVSCQYLDLVCSDGSKTPRKPMDTTTKNDKTETPNKVCDQNICRTQMEELKEKIVNLQEELSKTHEEYSGRIARLELEVVDLHSENMRVRGEKALWEHNMVARDNEADAIKKKLIETECYCEELSANLNIEKSKVAELQTQVKAANMTSDAVKTIEDRLYNENTKKGSRLGSVISTRSVVVHNNDVNRNSNLQSTFNSGNSIGIDDNNIPTDPNNQNIVNHNANTSNLKQTPDYGSPGISDKISGQTDPRHEKCETDTQRQISPINIYDDNDSRREGRREFVGRKDIANTGKSDNPRQISPDNIDGDIASRQERRGQSVSRNDTTSTSKADICRQMSPDNDNISGGINGDHREKHDCGSHNNAVSSKAEHSRQNSSENISRGTHAHHKKHDCGIHNNTDTSGKVNTRRQINPGVSDNTSGDIDSCQEEGHECDCSIDTANTGPDNTRPQVLQDISDEKPDFGKNGSPNASRRKNTNPWDNTGSSSFAPENDDVSRQTGKNTAALQEKQYLSDNSRELRENIDTNLNDTHRDNRQIATTSGGKIGSKNDCNTCQNNDIDNMNSDNNQNVTFDRQSIIKPTNNSQEIKKRRTSVVTLDIDKFRDDFSDADNRQQNKERHSDGTSRDMDTIREFDGHDIVNNRNENRGPGETSQVEKISENEGQETVNKDRHPSAPHRDLDNVSDIMGQSSPPNRQGNKDRHRASLRNMDIITWNDSDDRAYNRQNFPKTEYTTEYRSQFNDPRRLSPDLQSPLASPTKTQTRKPIAESQFVYGTEVIPEGEEKMKTSPLMSQLVNKSNESSCYCSGQCQCVKSIKNELPSTGSVSTKPATSDVSTDAKTPLVNASTEPDSRENVIPLTPEEQALIRKFMSLLTYTPIELGEPQSSRNPLAETSEQSAVNTPSAKTADDSGYADVSAPPEQEKELLRINQDLGKKIAEMQTQLDDLKTHMLLRKNTYTVFKDDATSVTDSVRKPGNEIWKTKNPCPSKVTASQTQNAPQTQNGRASRDSDETKLDSKRVVLKIPKKGYVIIQQNPEELKYQEASNSKTHDASDPFDANASCETTCGKEGLPCTKECMLKNKNDKLKYFDIKKETQKCDDDKKYSDVKKDAKRKDGDNRYQIPGPIAMDYESQRTQPDNAFSDIPITERFGYPTSYPPGQKQEQPSASVPCRFDDNKYETDTTSPNFYEGYSTGVRQNTCCIKSESPPINRTQNINIKDTPTNSRIPEANINAQYVKETQVIPNAQYTKIWNQPNIRESPNYPITENLTAIQRQKDITEATKNLDPKEDCCTRHQKLQEPIVISKPVENASVGAKYVKVHCACRAAKKTPVKCMCPPHSEYTMNVVHTSTTPITSPNQEDLKILTYGVSSKSNAESALSSNAQVKNHVPVANVTNLQNFDNTKSVTENKVVAGTATFETLIDNVNKREEFKKADVVDKPKRRLTKFEHNSEHWDKNERVGENKNQENTMTMSETAQLLRERSMSEANKIQRDKHFDRKFVEPIDECQSNVKTNLSDECRENRFITTFRENRYEDRYGDKSTCGEVNNKHETQKENIQENGPAKQIAKNNTKSKLNENKIQKEHYDIISLEKTKQDNFESFVDINGRERRFVDNDTGGEINNVDKNTISDIENNDKTEKDLTHYFEQTKPIPVATSSPFNSAAKSSTKKTKIDKATDNQLGTQLSDGDADKETEPKTYIIEASADFVTDKDQKDDKYVRGTSPENTDQEISSMTDLPSEKETSTTPSQTPRCHKCARYSLGEDKVATTKSDSPTLPTSSSPKTTKFSLSEGETKTLSEGEMPQYSAAAEKRAHIDPTRNEVGGGSTEKVEQALASISEELARCRLLLQKPKEAPTQRLKDLIEVEKYNSKDGDKERFEGMLDRNRAQSLSSQGSSHALRKSKAKPHIGNGPDTPHVMFTLHIGTVVLSDEAVINSRNLSLVLTWKFYDQNVAMSHMRPGRVVLFDFSTEYDLKLTDQFLQYLKTEELQIKVCEVNKLDAPLASCSLPLREALLHTNRRADMSLALVAGPQMQRSAPAADTLDTRDEMGVLDLWCMLRADPRIIPLINKVIAKSRPSRLPDDGSRQQSLANSPLSPLIMQLDDDQDEVHLSADLDQTFQNNDRLPVTDSRNLIERGAYNQTTLQMQQDRRRISNYGYVNVSESDNKRNLNNQPLTQYPAPRPKNPPEEKQDRKTDDPPQETKIASRPSWNTGDTYTKRTSSGYIMNEVPAVIKSDEQMKQAITERSKMSGRKSLTPTLQDKYEEAQTKTRTEPRVSYGDISIPSLRHRRNISTVTNNPEINSIGLGQSTYSLNKYWRRDDDIIKPKRTSGYQMQKKIIETGPLKDAGSMLMVTEQPEARTGRFDGSKKALETFKSIKTKKNPSHDHPFEFVESQARNDKQDHIDSQTVDITILWLALNEECSAMNDPSVQRLYVAYSFLGRSGAELETPVSLPKPKQYQDKCYFNFKKSFQLSNMDLDILGHMAQCRSPQKGKPNSNDSVVFTVVSEPVEDPLGLNNCEDIGFAHLFFGDLIAFSAGSDSYTEVIPVHDCRVDGSICGVLSIRVDGLDVVRKGLAIVSNGGRY